MAVWSWKDVKQQARDTSTGNAHVPSGSDKKCPSRQTDASEISKTEPECGVDGHQTSDVALSATTEMPEIPDAWSRLTPGMQYYLAAIMWGFIPPGLRREMTGIISAMAPPAIAQGDVTSGQTDGDGDPDTA